MRAIVLAAFVAAWSATLVGCVSHAHPVLVTSDPSAQRFSVRAFDEDGREVPAVNLGADQLTPYEVVFSGKATSVEVVVTFDAGDSQRKIVSLAHTPSSVEVYREPILGLPLGSTNRETMDVKKVHFDARPPRAEAREK